MPRADVATAEHRRGELRTSQQRYRMMRLSRRFEETVHDQFDDGAVPGPAAPLDRPGGGRGRRLRERCGRATRSLSTHRGHHHCLAKGARADRMMAELLGRTTGYSRGRGGSMHVAVPEIGLLGTNGIVGGGIPIATGAAYGMQVQGHATTSPSASSARARPATGVFGEALNIAALWTLPLVFICENNQYVELTPQSVHVAGEIWRRGESLRHARRARRRQRRRRGRRRRRATPSRARGPAAARP